MNKTYLRIIAIVMFVIICAKTQFLSALFSLVVMGIVPGTNLSIPAWLMLITYPAAFVLILRWISRQPLFIGAPAEAQAATRPTTKKRRTTKSASKTSKTTKKKVTQKATTRRRYRSV